MGQSDDLELQEFGSLQQPAIYGRFIRLVLGGICLFGLTEVISLSTQIVTYPFSMLPNLSLLVVAPILILNYVVNIGFGVNWHRLPIIVSLTTLSVLFLASWMMTNSFDHEIVGFVLLLWLIYFYAHLGISFVLAGLIATPGCEMRAIPHLFGKMTGRGSSEHHCPVPLITRIDEWESSLHE